MAYTMYDSTFHEVTDGRLDRPELSIREARKVILSDMKMGNRSRTDIGHGFLMDMVKTATRERESLLGRLQNTKMEPRKAPEAAPRRKMEGGKDGNKI